jgi:hypothetical protein
MGIAIIQLAPGITDPDHWFSIEYVGWKPFGAEPGSPSETVVFRGLKPLAAAIVFHGVSAQFSGRTPV